MLYLPHTDFNVANVKNYNIVWWISMTPRFFFNIRRLLKYASDSVVDPKITRNVKQFQFVKIVIYIIAFAHLIGCFYYFLARIHNFDDTTWIHAFEQALPFYEYKSSPVSGEYLLVIFKGFCRVASLGFDPGLPGNIPELVWAMFVMFLSVYVSSMILGTLLTFLVRRDPAEVAHKERMEALKIYMESKHVPEDLHENVIRYCQFQYSKNRGNDSSSGNDLVKSLSRSLRIEVANANHRDLINRCSKIGRPLHRCSQGFLNDLVVKLYTVHVMPGDHIVHKDEIPRELYFVAQGAVQVVDEHDQVVSVIRSDVPDTAPLIGEVPFFLGINYMKAIKASLDGDVQLQVLSKHSLTELISEFPEDHNTICQNLWSQFDIGRTDAKPAQGKKATASNDGNLDKEKLMTKARILESTTFRKEQQFRLLCKAARTGDMNLVVLLARQGTSLNQTDYDGRTAMHMACTGGRYKVVEGLIKLGVDVNVKDRWGQTPMAISILAKQSMIITVLASAKAKLDMESPELTLCTAAGSGDMTQVKRLVEFGVLPNVGDYDKRTALHVAAAEGHEKIVEFLLLSQADPNSKDRWGGTPLQDALSGQHIGTAHILKAKGAEVPNEFGAEAVCTAAGKGDVPKLRMLHSFGQSLDVGDYDERYALHLASAEGRVLAVSFLLGISSDPNKMDRWEGTPMDDCVRGGTLYHKYCAKLLQGWGGELGTFKDSKEGLTFLTELEQISIKSIREVIRRLIDQGLDKVCPDRMNDQQLLVVMSATVRHMPLVTQLHRNTSVITKEIKHFRTVVQTFVFQIRENIETVLATLLKGTRRVPEFEVSIRDDVKPPPRRPKTARQAKPITRTELHLDVDQFSGLEQVDNSRVLDSLLLESPLHSHKAVAMPRKLMKRLNNTLKLGDVAEMQEIESIRVTDQIDGHTRPNSAADDSVLLCSSSNDQQDFEKLHKESRMNIGFKEMQSSSMADVIKRNNQRTDSLVKTLFDSTVPPTIIRECFQLIKKGDQQKYRWMTEASEGFLDSDVEQSLHIEIDNITSTQDLIEHNVEVWWEKHGSKLFTQLALNIVNTEQAYMLLHNILCSSLPVGVKPEADPMLATEHVARGLVALYTSTRTMDLDKAVEEVHGCMKAFRLLQTPKERRANKDEASGNLRFSTLVSASPSFRTAIFTMDVDQTLCLLMKSSFSEIFDEAQARGLLPNSRRETKNVGDVLHNDNNTADHKFLTLIIKGEVLVLRTLDEDEIGRGKCTVGCFFGAWKALNQPNGIPEIEKETPVKEGGTGVNNCLIKADSKCEIIRIPVSNLREVLTSIKEIEAHLLNNKMLETLASDVTNLERLNTLVIAGSKDADFVFVTEQEQWTLPVPKRKYYKGVPELQRQDIQESFLNIQNLWRHLSRGANTVPKGHVDLIKDLLGESGLQCYNNVFAPMDEPTAPLAFDADSFWYCWINFLAKSIKNIQDEDLNHEDNDDDEHGQSADQASGKDFKGVATIMIKNGTKLSPMDTFTGKADPYLLVNVDGVMQKSQVKAGTLEPIWNETMQFNSIANRSVVRIEVFDSEAMGQDRIMGTFSFVVQSSPNVTSSNHNLTGQLVDGRLAQGVINVAVSFVKGARATKTVEQKNEFQIFCDSENYYDLLMFWLRPSRRIEHAFFKIPLPLHEREFTKAVGTLSVPLTGLAIKQYLTYVLVEHSHHVDIYSCREFCSFFKRKLNDETSIMYRDIVKIVKERNSGVNNNEVLIGTALNPYHWIMQIWISVARLVSLYHVIMVPLRISFQSEANTLTSRLPLSTDLPADFFVVFHLIVSLNTGYKNAKSQWVTKRFRIFKVSCPAAILSRPSSLPPSFPPSLPSSLSPSLPPSLPPILASSLHTGMLVCEAWGGYSG